MLFGGPHLFRHEWERSPGHSPDLGYRAEQTMRP